jgi:hypothetical protein
MDKKTSISILDIFDREVAKCDTGDNLYEEFPVNIAEFIDSPDFLDQKKTIWPGIRDILIDFFQFEPDGWLKYNSGVVIAGLGAGKSKFVSIAITYLVYRLLCLRSPQLYFRETLKLESIEATSTIQIVNFAPSADQARRVVFDYISSDVGNCAWFIKKGYAPDSNVTSELRFPKNVTITPGSSSAKPALGLHLLITVFDEMSFFDKTRETDYAKELYQLLTGRMRSRFSQLDGRARWLFLGITSAQTADDYSEELFKDSKNTEYGFARRLTFWEAKRHLFADCASFDYKVTDVAGNLIEVIKVPEVYRDELERNPVLFLRDVAGRPSLAVHPFFTDFSKVLSSIDETFINPVPEKGWESGGYLKPLSFLPTDLLQILKEIQFQNKVVSGAKYIISLDLAKGVRDKLGFGMSHLDSYKRESRFDKDGKAFLAELPIVVLDLIVRFVALPGTEISFADVRELIFMLKKTFGFDIKLIVSDSFESLDFKQIMLAAGYDFLVYSADTHREVYDNFSELISDKRIIWYRHEPLLYEAQRVEDLGARIDHPRNSGKDLLDAACLATYFASGGKKMEELTGTRVTAATTRRGKGALSTGLGGGGAAALTPQLSETVKRILGG